MTPRAKSYHDKTIRGIRKNLMETSAQSNQIKFIYCPVHKVIAGNEISLSLPKIFSRKATYLPPRTESPCHM